MKITNSEILQNEKGEKIIKLLFNGEYDFIINCNTLDTMFDNTYPGELDFELDEEDLKAIEENPNEFFYNNRFLQLIDWGGQGLNVTIRNGSKKDYEKVALKYDCYLGQCWDATDYDYILFLQMDYE